jgi:hypothetical protein
MWCECWQNGLLGGASKANVWIGLISGDRAPGCSVAWNRLDATVEQRGLELRRQLREHSILGQYGAEAIQQSLEIETESNAQKKNRGLAMGYYIERHETGLLVISSGTLPN